MPVYMSVKYNAKYRDLYCDGNHKAAVRNFINKHTEKVIQDLPCIQRQICSHEGVEIHNCDELKRRKRATTTVNFQLDISTTPNIGKCKVKTKNPSFSGNRDVAVSQGC